jgi:hypothetical protein
MSWSPIGIGGSGASGYRTGYPSVGRTGVPNRPIGGMTVNVEPSSSDRLSLDEAREQIRAATDAFRAAFGAFTAGSKAVSATTLITNPASTASLGGSSARVNSLFGAYSTLATGEINTQVTPPDPSSSAAIGLDLASVLSTLGSGALGLDVTSAQAASTLKSSAALGLDTTSAESSSTITSMAAVNTASTSYSPSVSMNSGTATVALSGVYAGAGNAASASTLQFKMLSNVTMGSTAASVHFQVYNGSTRLVDYTGTLKAGDKIYLGDEIGLYATFSAGTVVNNATGNATVSKTAPTINTSATFNNADPNLRPQLDRNAQITAGSFTINGTSIAVNANDSISSVISRINASAAGVNASFANNKLTLTTKTASDQNIYLANDTSGFLSAMKLVSPNEEINSATTSYTSNTLKFGLGTSVATLSGTYLGVGSLAGNTSLTVKVMSNIAALSSVVATNVHFQVLDSSNHTVVDYSGAVKAGDKIAIDPDAGLWISFSSGSLVNNETATTAVSNTTKTDVNAAATFNNADANLRPRFENGAQVTAGSFTVNGTAVTVNANDSINSVLARINSTVSGVTATFANDRITIVNNSGTNPVVLGNDTSGFLAATKLATAVTSTGHAHEDAATLANTAHFASVTNGSFSINGVSISVNRSTDTLNSVLARINSSGAGVTASYDATQDKVVLTTNGYSEDQITVSGDTSGFTTAVKLSTGNTVRGNIRDDQQVLSKTTQFGSVATGSFTINGVSISIDKNTDTISSIVSRINGVGAGVTAAFNASTNKIELATTSASEDLINVGNDTTGFLAATGLNSANTVRGKIADDTQALSATAAFAGVTNGSFTINGVAIAVDPGQDSLNTLIARINTSGAGVTASYNASTDKLTIGRNVAGSTLAIENDTSGFLAAAHVATGVTGTSFDPDAAFNATGAGAPAFDNGRRVQAGSFTVNGTTITVAGDDTVNKVLAKITASAAGVTATYDSATESVRLTRKDAGSDPIVLGSDTSGFIAAVKLDSAQSTTGSPTISAFDAKLNQMPEYSGVNAGTITVNGQQIAVDPATTTIRGLVSSLNSVSGVVATLDETSGAIRISSTTAGDTITISDTSGVLSKLGIAADTYVGSLESTSVVETRTKGIASNATNVVDKVAAAVDKLNEALSKLGLGDKESPFRDELTTEVEDAFDVLRQAGVEGFDVRTDDPAKLELSVDRDRLARSLNKLGEQANARKRIDEALEGFSAHMAKVGDAPASEGSQNGQPVFGSTNYVWARLTADQAATALLYMKSTLQPVKSDVTAAKAAERYAATSDAAKPSDRPDRFELTNQLQDALAAAQVTVPMTPAPPPPAEPAKPAVPKIGKADSGSRGLTDRNRSTSPFGGVNETAEKRDRRDEDTFEYRGSDRHVPGTRTRRGARRGLRDTLRTIAGRQR